MQYNHKKENKLIWSLNLDVLIQKASPKKNWLKGLRILFSCLVYNRWAFLIPVEVSSKDFLTVERLLFAHVTPAKVAHAHLRRVADVDGTAVHEAVVVEHGHSPTTCRHVDLGVSTCLQASPCPAQDSGLTFSLHWSKACQLLNCINFLKKVEISPRHL